MATILVVDDRPNNRQFLLALLGDFGHELLEAANGLEALELIQSARPDLVITDILMPTMDGYELVTRLRADPQSATTPVIFYTATYSEAQAMRLAASCGVDTVLPKPTDPSRILAAVDRALDGRGQASGLDTSKAQQAEPDPARWARATYLRDLQDAKDQFRAIAERDAAARSESPRALNPPKGSSGNGRTLQRITLRLCSLIEAGFAMSTEHDSDRLLDVFFATASDLIDSRVSALALLNQEETALEHVMVRGIDADIFIHGGHVLAGPLHSLLTQPRTIRGRRTEFGTQDPLDGIFPYDNILALSVASSDRTYGWICFADRIGASEFSEEDELLLGIIVAKFALRYEHAMLFDVIQSHAASLQLEVTQRRRAQEALLESEGRFRQLAENIREVFWLTDPAKRQMLYVSPAYEEIWGRSVVGIYANPQDWLDAIHPDDRQRVVQAAHAKQVSGNYDEEYRIVRPDGSIRWIRDRAFPVREASGQIIRVAGVAEDITDRKREAQKLERLTRTYAVLSGINAAIVRIHGREELFRECCRIAVEAGRFALARVHVVESDGHELATAAAADMQAPSGRHGGNVPRPIDNGASGPAARAVREMQAIVLNKSDADPDSASRDPRAGSIAALPLFVSGEAVGALELHSAAGTFDQDEMRLLLELAEHISFALEHIDRAEKIQYLTLFDSSTGLANQALFLDRLGQRLHLAARVEEQLAVVLADIERLATVNASFGRQAGDSILKQFAERLARGAARDELARVGGHLFAILLPATHGETDVSRRVGHMWRNCFGEPFAIEGSDLRFSAKVGIALYPRDGMDAEGLLRSAEAALRRAQQSGERCVFHAAEMMTIGAEWLSLENNLRRALENDEYVLHYQSKVDLETRSVVGAEALIRWQSPDQGLVLPGRFIALLEETGLILEVGAWALQRAVRDRGQCTAQGITLPHVAVNVSSIQLRQRDFVDLVREAVAQSATPTNLHLEITESVLMEDIAGNIEKLKALRELGVRMTIDDFGTGYSSLAYLAKLPVDSLKIDRSFVAGMLSDPDTMTLVSTIVSLAHSLRLTVVAEGVETEEQAAALRALGCEQAQGYLFSRPVPLEQLMRALHGTE